MTPQQAAALLGETLRTRREELDLSQSQVAQHSGVHHTHWSKIESGQARPSVQVLIRACAILKLDLGALEGLKELEIRLPGDEQGVATDDQVVAIERQLEGGTDG